LDRPANINPLRAALFTELVALGISQHRDMAVLGGRSFEYLLYGLLSKARLQEVSASNYMGVAFIQIIHGGRKLIGDSAIFALDDKIIR
jgi:hypothetical protein